MTTTTIAKTRPGAKAETDRPMDAETSAALALAQRDYGVDAAANRRQRQLAILDASAKGYGVAAIAAAGPFKPALVRYVVAHKATIAAAAGRSAKRAEREAARRAATEAWVSATFATGLSAAKQRMIVDAIMNGVEAVADRVGDGQHDEGAEGIEETDAA